MSVTLEAEAKAWQGPCGSSVREYMRALKHATDPEVNRHDVVRHRDDVLVPLREHLRSIEGLLRARADYGLLRDLIRYKHFKQAENWAKTNRELLESYQ